MTDGAPTTLVVVAAVGCGLDGGVFLCLLELRHARPRPPAGGRGHRRGNHVRAAAGLLASAALVLSLT